VPPYGSANWPAGASGAGAACAGPVRAGEEPPAFMNSWSTGHRARLPVECGSSALGDTAYRDIAAAAAFATYEEPGPNVTLCCGQAGHVFALLNMYRHTQEEAWLRLASERLQSALPATTPGGAGGATAFTVASRAGAGRPGDRLSR